MLSFSLLKLFRTGSRGVVLPLLRTLHTLSTPLEAQVRDHYQVLGVDRTANKEEIKDAFVTLSKQYHPDLNPGRKHTNQAFVEVSEAYQTLIHPKRKEKYDSELRVAETYRTQYEQRFYRAPPSGRPFESQNHSAYSSGGGHRDFYHQYDDSDVDWDKYRMAVVRPQHRKVVYLLISLVVTVPAVFIFKIVYNYSKYCQELAVAETERNTATYFAVREKAKSSSVQEQLDRLVQRHAETMSSLASRPPNR